ncbi:hypothetical protein GBA52_023978 [Prunus armeniaca]|nr:hypothetical protein GBA52_023978 [Prunus armeniaca]
MHPRDWIKVNFDGSVRDNMAATEAKNIGQVSINVADCLALRDGLAHAINNGWRKFLIEGDSKLDEGDEGTIPEPMHVEEASNECTILEGTNVVEDRHEGTVPKGINVDEEDDKGTVPDVTID